MLKLISDKIEFRGWTACLLVALLVTCGAGCDSSSTQAKPPAAVTASAPVPATVRAAVPKLVVKDGETFDFGTTEVNQEFEHVFEVQNAGQADVVVKAGRPSCTTCTSFKIDKELLKPGETLKATVKWHIKSENPEFRQYAPLEPEGGAQLKLFVVGKVVKRIVMSPSDRWQIGDVIDGKPSQFQATITSAILDKFEIPEITAGSPALKVTATPLSSEKLAELKVKSGYDLNVTLDSEIPIGEFSDIVRLKVLAPDPVPLKIDVSARRSGPIQIFGPNWKEQQMLLDLGNFDPKQGTTARLNLFARGFEGELKIESVTCDDKRFTFELKPDLKFQTQAQGPRKYDLFVKVAPGSRDVVYTIQKPLRVVIDTNQPKVGQIKMQLKSLALP